MQNMQTLSNNFKNKQQQKYNSTYVCTRYRVFTYLRSLGFEEYKTVPDCKNPKFNVFLFNRTSELEQAVNNYYIEAKEKGRLK